MSDHVYRVLDEARPLTMAEAARILEFEPDDLVRCFGDCSTMTPSGRVFNAGAIMAAKRSFDEAVEADKHLPDLPDPGHAVLKFIAGDPPDETGGGA